MSHDSEAMNEVWHGRKFPGGPEDLSALDGYRRQTLADIIEAFQAVATDFPEHSDPTGVGMLISELELA